MEHDGEASRVAGHRPDIAGPALADRAGPSLPAILFFVPLSLLGGLFPAFSLSANLYVLTLGVTLLIVGVASRAQPRQGPAVLPPGVVWWLLPIVLFAVVEAITFVMGTSPDRIYNYPTLSLLADPLLDSYYVRSLAYFGWLTVFWRLIRR